MPNLSAGINANLWEHAMSKSLGRTSIASERLRASTSQAETQQLNELEHSAVSGRPTVESPFPYATGAAAQTVAVGDD